MSKTVADKIDKFLLGEDKIDELTLSPSETGIKAGEYNNISTGLKRVMFRLEKANTPQKYVDAFEVIQQLVAKFPLKSKVIWQTVANAYEIRFGSIGGAPVEVTNTTNVPVE